MTSQPPEPDAIRMKFGGDYLADALSFIMGIDCKLTEHLARRFQGRTVLETCTGGGFSAMALARHAKHVISVEIDAARMAQAQENVRRAGVEAAVTFVHGDVMSDVTGSALPPYDAAFLDPDWAVSGPGHVFRFRASNTRPPADALLSRMFACTSEITLIQPPDVDVAEFEGLPPHERESLYLGGEHALNCLHFGDLARTIGATEARF